MTSTESCVAQIFETVLTQKPIAFDEDFITLGGDSLAAMLCISRIRSQFQVELSVEDFFMGTSTVRSISGLIDEQLAIIRRGDK